MNKAASSGSDQHGGKRQRSETLARPQTDDQHCDEPLPARLHNITKSNVEYRCRCGIGSYFFSFCFFSFLFFFLSFLIQPSSLQQSHSACAVFKCACTQSSTFGFTHSLTAVSGVGKEGHSRYGHQPADCGRQPAAPRRRSAVACSSHHVHLPQPASHCRQLSRGSSSSSHLTERVTGKERVRTAADAETQ